MVGPEILTEKGGYTVPESGTRTQLLVVDDDTDIQKLLYRTLALMGYDVNLAGNGHEAMNLFVTNCYDLVITDFQMPLMDGWQLSHLVKERSPNTPVLMITGGCDKDSLIQTLRDQSGFSKYQSTAVVDRVFELIKNALESGEAVLISGFGKFIFREKAARRGRNPATGEDINLDARKVITFKCSPVMRDRINDGG
jgi:integration host factor subunit alpha